MPNFAYTPGVNQNVAAAGQVVAPVLSGGAVLPFPVANSQAVVNLRGNTQAATQRATAGSAILPAVDISADALLPASVGAGATWTSPILPSLGLTHAAIALNSTQGGKLTLSQYADTLGQLLTVATTVTMTANITASLDVASSTLFQSFTFGITNTAASNAVISSAIALLSSK